VHALILLLGAVLADESPRIASQPTRVCVEAQKAIFQVENPGPTPVVAALSIEHWSPGDGDEWITIHQDVTQREAQTSKVRKTRVDARSRRDFDWALKGRKGPLLTTGRHRLVVVLTDEKGEPIGKLLHEFTIADCRY
jgi:P pilus assembly chaperone PapD